MSTVIEPLPQFAGILKNQQTFGTGSNKGVGDRLNTSFDKLLLQSGLTISPVTLLLLVLVGGIAIGGTGWVITENLLTAGLGFFIGATLPIATVVVARGNRQRAIMTQLPEMVDELARAARTGRSVEQCFALVAADTPSPLGDEIRLCARKVELGLTLKEALAELSARTGVVTLSILAMALGVHQVTGGDLVAVLDRLARTVRERNQYLGRLRAATAASRATAILMIALPPAILLFFAVRDPQYMTTLWSVPWARFLTIIAILLDIVGIVWVLRILRTSSQT